MLSDPAALLTGRNHHSVGMGAITEMATSAPGNSNSSIRPKTRHRWPKH
jgi:arylsulfatase